MLKQSIAVYEESHPVESAPSSKRARTDDGDDESEEFSTSGKKRGSSVKMCISCSNEVASGQFRKGPHADAAADHGLSCKPCWEAWTKKKQSDTAWDRLPCIVPGCGFTLGELEVRKLGTRATRRYGSNLVYTG